MRKQVLLKDLEPGMILAQPIISPEGDLLMGEGTVLTMFVIALLQDPAYMTEVLPEGVSIDEMTLESSNRFLTGSNSGVNCPELGGETDKDPKDRITLTPKIGVSPIPTGCILIRYGNTDRYAASIKVPTKFAMYYKLSYNGGLNDSWFEF